MTAAWLKGKRTKLQGQEIYACRPQEPHRNRRRHSNFWLGLYGNNWIVSFHECQSWVENLIASARNK